MIDALNSASDVMVRSLAKDGLNVAVGIRLGGIEGYDVGIGEIVGENVATVNDETIS